ncbi:hypothetical protein CR513_39207, partial [Mucuna pruriens]
MDPTQLNYTTIEMELLAILFAMDKFHSFLLGSKIIVFSNHATLKFLLKKLDKGAENLVVDHLSQIERESDSMPIRDEFHDEQVLQINTITPWFADICNFVAASQFPPEASRLYKERLKSDAICYIWDDPYLWIICNDQVIHRCIPNTEINSVLQFCHAASGGNHYGSTRTTWKILDCRFYWCTIFRDTYQIVSTCEKCQKAGMAISRRHEMPQQPILFCEVFDIWGIDFMGPFPVSNEVIATKTNDAKVVVDFLKSNIFCRFGVPKAFISDQGSHFCNRAMSALLHKYGVVHRVSIAYHPQTNNQVEVFNREIKKTLQKMANPNRKD